MTDKRHAHWRHRRHSRSGLGCLLPLPALLLTGALLAAALSPHAPLEDGADGTKRITDQLAENLADNVPDSSSQSTPLAAPAQKGTVPQRSPEASGTVDQAGGSPDSPAPSAPLQKGSSPDQDTEPGGIEDWMLTLVNPWNPLSEDWSIQTVELRNGFQIDQRCYPDLQDMMDACRAEGLSPLICSAYRTQAYQERLFQTQVEVYLAQGWSQAKAETEAGKAVAVPGTSEHQLGLAVDIVDTNNQHLDKSQENTAVQKWLMAHSWEYGFILRYPSEKSEITGIIYEPWHYRYVGKEAAREIYELGVCLEEYREEGQTATAYEF